MKEIGEAELELKIMKFRCSTGIGNFTMLMEARRESLEKAGAKPKWDGTLSVSGAGFKVGDDGMARLVCPSVKAAAAASKALCAAGEEYRLVIREYGGRTELKVCDFK